MSEENQRLVDVLEFPENVRLNSAMYIGDRETSSHILREIIDNSVDEALDPNSTCDEIHIYQGEEDEMNTRWFCVTDNGRGIPILDSPKKPGMTMSKVSISFLSSGSNFADRKGERTSIGMNGVGSAVTNALSNHYYLAINMAKQMHNFNGAPEEFKELYNKAEEKEFYLLHYEKGYLKEETFISKDKLKLLIPEFQLPEEFTTLVAFQPDTESIFTKTNSNPTKDLRYLQPFLEKVKGRKLKFWVNNEPYETDWSSYKWEFKTSCGSLYNEDYLKKKEIFDTLDDEAKKKFRLPIKPRNTSAEVYVSFEVDMEKMDNPIFTGSVNGLIVPKRVHTDWVKQAFSLAMKNIYSFDFKQREFVGMNFDVIFSCVAPEFNSQTKEVLVRVDGISSQDLVPKLAKEFEKVIRANRETFDAHANRVKALLMTMANLSLQDYCKAKVPVSTDQRRYHAALKETKLNDCRSSNRGICELYIAEGDSAGGPLLACRDGNIHAVLPLRGKVKNVVSKDVREVLDNKELTDIYLAIGAGTNENPDLDAARYGKIIIATDADPDGFNIRALVAGFFVTHLTFLVEAGLVYVLESPLYEQNGKFFYDKSDAGFDENKPYKRFKGLGSMNNDQAKQTLLDPQSRRLTKLTLSDPSMAKWILTSRQGRRELLEDISVIDPDTELKFDDIDMDKATEIVE